MTHEEAKAYIEKEYRELHTQWNPAKIEGKFLQYGPTPGRQRILFDWLIEQIEPLQARREKLHATIGEYGPELAAKAGAAIQRIDDLVVTFDTARMSIQDQYGFRPPVEQPEYDDEWWFPALQEAGLTGRNPAFPDGPPYEWVWENRITWYQVWKGVFKGRINGPKFSEFFKDGEKLLLQGRSHGSSNELKSADHNVLDEKTIAELKAAIYPE